MPNLSRSGLVWSVRDGLFVPLLDRASGVAQEILNPVPDSRGAPAVPMAAAALVGELRVTALALKADAFDPESGRPDYRRVAGGAGLQRLRERCTPMLHELDLALLRTRQERLAFWINLYNVLLIDAVIAYEIRRSVKEARGGLWGFFHRAAYAVGGHRFSLDEIEHGVLRANRGHPRVPGPQFRAGDPRLQYVLEVADPRVHCALNCGGASCPPIAAYDAERIDAELDAAARGFVNSPSGVEVRAGEGVARVSQIFRSYRGDFGGAAGVREFLASHLDDAATAAAIRSGALRLVWMPYDWSLA